MRASTARNTVARGGRLLLCLLSAASVTWGQGRTTPTGSLSVARFQHTATRLNDGRVLIVGGRSTDATTALNSVELYTPQTGRFAAIAPLHTGRALHTATLLSDGRVLVIGGIGEETTDGGSALRALRSTEVFDPKTLRWAEGPVLTQARSGHTATLTGSTVFIAGGLSGPRQALASSERISSSLVVTPGPSLQTARAAHLAFALSSGAVLLTGGRGGASVALADSEQCTERACEALGALPEAVQRSAGVDRREGPLLLGGYGPASSTNYVQHYSLDGGTWQLHPPHLSLAVVSHTATALPDASVLVTGGETPLESDSRRVQVLHGDAWCLAGTLRTSRKGHTATLLANGAVLIAGGTSAGLPEASAELWQPSAGPCEEPGGLLVE